LCVFLGLGGGGVFFVGGVFFGSVTVPLRGGTHRKKLITKLETNGGSLRYERELLKKNSETTPLYRI